DLDLDDGPARRCDVFLVDGNGLAYRAFYALPEELQTIDGQPTNALLGTANMLMKLLVDYRPTVVLVAWDERPAERLELAPDYKAHRKPTPERLRRQQPLMQPLVEAFGYRNVRAPGKEADDVIGTLARQAERAGHHVCVVSTDRDAFQLASEQVCVMMTPRGVSDVVVYTPDRIRRRYGIDPVQVPDFIGLKGDSSDNIKGVPGIGDKTAADLLVRFSSLEGVYEHLGEISGDHRREALAASEQEARTSKRLATIDTAVDLGVDWAVLAAAPPDRSTMGELFRRLEFRALLGRLDELERALPGTPRPVVAGEPVGWREADVAAIATLPREVGLAVAGDRAALAPAEGDVLVVPGGGDRIVEALGDRAAITHGLHHPGLEPRGDTALAAYLVDPNRSGYEIEQLATDAGVELEVQADPETAELVRAATLAQRLHPMLAARVEERGMDQLYRTIELPLAPVLGAMERVGIRVDSYRLAEIAAKLHDQVEELEARAHELAGGPFALGSPKQLGEVLFERLGLPTDRRGKTGYSTDARVLAKLRDLHPIVEAVEGWREQSKLLNTYLQPLPEMVDPADGRLHSTFSQTTAATGRLSSIRPNLQNIPVRTPLGREIRSAFVAEEGWRLLSADYSQVELRILAHLSGEPVLAEAFARGEDIHRATAAEVLGKPQEELTTGERNRAKAVNFGIIYGISSFGLSEQLNISREEAQAYIDRYLARFPRVREFMEATIAAAREDGHVTTLFGRRRPIPELRASNFQTRSLGERLAVNTVMQGSAADIIKVAMIGCHHRLRNEGRRSRLVLQIHDELLFEVADGELSALRALVESEMTGAYPLDPPLRIEIGVGETWLDAK
ncbi:MAG TPA: DNA polymerase I, partial [Gaiellales bacterium]|nr:DNA polymerase I [Gaiellales bacterium]